MDNTHFIDYNFPSQTVSNKVNKADCQKNIPSQYIYIFFLLAIEKRITFLIMM